MAHSAVMDSIPALGQLSEPAKEAIIVALWAEVQHLRARLSALENTPPEPVKDAGDSRVPPSPPQAPMRLRSQGVVGGVAAIFPRRVKVVRL